MLDEHNLEAIRSVGERFRGKGRWPVLQETVPDHVPVFLEGESLEDMNVVMEQMAEMSVQLQMDLFMLPSPVKEAFFPFIMLFVSKQDGLVMSQAILTPEPDMQSMYEGLPEVVLGKLAELGFRPECLEIRSERLYGLMDRAAKEAWLSLSLVKDMPLLDEARDSLLEGL